MKREYTYYLPKELLPNDEALEKFRGLLKLFVGTHSFHNYASTKGRQLKEVRKRVQASIDLKKAGVGGGVGGAAAGAGSTAASDAELEGRGADDSGSKKRWRSKEEWRTYRHKKKSAVDQKAEDTWFGKSQEEKEEDGSAAVAEGDQGSSSSARDALPSETVALAVVSGMNTDTSVEPPVAPEKQPKSIEGEGEGGSSAEASAANMDVDRAAAGAPAVGEDGDGVESEKRATVAAGEAASAAAEKGGDDKTTDGGPEKQILLRELRTR